MSAAGVPRVLMAGVPAMTLREVRLGVSDKNAQPPRHWSRGQCWCRDRHQGEAGELLMVPPPWDAERSGESTR